MSRILPAIFLVDPKRKALRRVTGVGVRNKPDTVALGEELKELSTRTPR